MLAAEACIVTAPNEAIKALRACVRAAGADIEDIIPGPFAAGLSGLTEEERDEGALLLDLGAGGVGVAAFAAEGLVYCETMPSCGVRLTRDLAAKLQTSFAAAERVKLAYGAIGGGFDPREPVSAPRLGADGRLEAAVTLRGVIADSMAPRLHGLFMQVRDRLARGGVAGEALPKRCVLVGGVSQLPGVRELAADVLGMAVRLSRPTELCGFDHGETGPGFAAGAGLLRWRMDHPELADVEESFQPSLAGAAYAMRSAAGKAWDWLRDNF
jgi:cell division protein FtsA